MIGAFNTKYEGLKWWCKISYILDKVMIYDNPNAYGYSNILFPTDKNVVLWIGRCLGRF